MAYPRIRGRQNLKNLRGPLLFISNHVTQADIAFVLAALPARFRHRLAVAMNGEMLQKCATLPAASVGSSASPGNFPIGWLSRSSTFFLFRRRRFS